MSDRGGNLGSGAPCTLALVRFVQNRPSNDHRQAHRTAKTLDGGSKRLKQTGAARDATETDGGSSKLSERLPRTQHAWCTSASALTGRTWLAQHITRGGAAGKELRGQTQALTGSRGRGQARPEGDGRCSWAVCNRRRGRSCGGRRKRSRAAEAERARCCSTPWYTGSFEPYLCR